METEITPEYKRLEQRLDFLQKTVDSNRQEQEERLNSHSKETQQCLIAIQDQLCDINHSIASFRDRYDIESAFKDSQMNRELSARLGDGRTRQVSTNLNINQLGPSVARIRRKSWAGGSRPAECGNSLSSGSEVNVFPDERMRKEEFRRQCMASAIKRNMVGIVDALPFKESEIPDTVIETCLNECECERIRGLSNRRQQIRELVTMVIKREFEVMESFLKIVSQHNGTLHKNIQDTYIEMLEESRMPKKLCTLCTLARDVDIQIVCDHLYERDMLPDSVYDEIIRSSSSESLWWKMLNSITNVTADVIMSVIIFALMHHGKFYTNIARMLQRDIQRRRRLICHCPRLAQPPSGDTTPSMSSADSLSSHVGFGNTRDLSETTPKGQSHDPSQDYQDKMLTLALPQGIPASSDDSSDITPTGLAPEVQGGLPATNMHW